MRTQSKAVILSALLLQPLAGLAQDTVASQPEAAAAPAPAPDAVAASGDTAEVGAGVTADAATVALPSSIEKPVAAAPARGASSSRLVEEIVVTAQKREENIQDVPISIAAFSAEKLDALGIETAEDLERVTPGLTITNAAGYNVAYLRGVGTDAFLPGADPSVPFYLDGVPLLGTQGSSDALGRIERVEVLKGPQGTLFGRNSTGGAISIITPEPTHDFGGDVSLQYGNYAQRKATGYVNLPVGDQLALSLAAFGITQNNFYTNDTGPIIGIYNWGGRAKLRWDASENFRVTLAASYQQASDNGGLTFENTRVAPDFRLVLPQDPKADRHVSFDSLSGAKNNAELYSATVEWKLPWVDVKTILSDQRLNAEFVQADFDKSNLPIVNIQSQRQLSRQDTGELQFLSNAGTPFGERFKWVGGLFVIRSSGGFDPIAFEVAPGALATLGGAAGAGLQNALNRILGRLGQNLDNGIRLYNYGVLRSLAYSAYFQGTLSIFDSLDLTLGARLQHEDRDLLGSRTTLPAQGDGDALVLLQNSPPTLRSNQASPRIALQWRPFGEGTQIYASAARGYKSPTYNTVNLIGGLPQGQGIKPLKAERVNTIELGVKTELFENSLRVNSAAFYTRQHDLLTGFVAVTSGGIVAYDNAPAARIFGAEIDALWSPLRVTDPGLVFTLAGTYLDAKYTDYPNGKGFDVATGLAFGSGGTELLPARDFKGNRIVRTPRGSGNAGISQTLPIGSGSLELATDVAYSSPFFFLPQNEPLYSRSAYFLGNARVTYIYDPWGLQVGAFVNNFTDKSYNEVVFVDDFGRNQVLNAPRTYGVRAKLSF